MDTPGTIEKYNNISQRHRLYQFLWALDDKYDGLKKEILNREPLPTVRAAYTMARRESANEQIFKPTEERQEAEIGTGLAAINRGRPQNSQFGVQTQRTFPPTPTPIDKSRLTCSHCGGKKHTSETCFHLHGFPDWWEDIKKSRQGRNRTGGSKATAAAATTGATITEISAGSNGGRYIPRTSDKKSGNTETEREENATASVSVARVWTEGNQTSATAIAGTSSTGEKGKIGWSRVPDFSEREIGFERADRTAGTGVANKQLRYLSGVVSEITPHTPDSRKIHSEPRF